MNLEHENLNLLQILPNQQCETGAECEIILPDYCPNILRILQTSALPAVRAQIRNGDRLTVEGTVDYRILYLPEDGTGISVVTQQCPFSSTFDLKCGEDADLNVTAEIRNAAARALSPQKMFARCSVLLKLNADLEMICNPTPPAGNYEFRIAGGKAARKIAETRKPLRISDEFEIDAAAAAILETTVTYRETEQKPLADKLIVKADMTFDLLCIREDGSTVPLHKTFPISQILDLPGMQEDSVCTARFETASANLLLKDASEEGTQSVVYDVEIEVFAGAYEEAEYQWAEDAYSVRKTVECTRTPVTTERFTAIREEGTVRETVEIGACSEILWLEIRPELKNTSYREDTGRIVCEGVWNCRALMKDPEGTPCTAVREVPFTLETEANGAVRPVRNGTQIVLTDLTWTTTDLTHMEFRGTYHWNGLIFTEQTTNIVTEIRETGDRPRSGNTLVLCYAVKGESVWEIAQKYACPYEELKQTNRLEQDILDSDRMLTVICC